MLNNTNKCKAASGKPDYKVVLGALMLSLFLFTACQKNPVPGPVGPAGKQGNANVTDNQYTVNRPYWNWDTVAHAYFQAQTDSAITQSILDKGAVLVYFSIGSSVWQPLPFTANGIEWGYSINLYGLNLRYSKTDGSRPVYPHGLLIKVVCISGMVIDQHPCLDLRD
jgi:hypothetical protein